MAWEFTLLYGLQEIHNTVLDAIMVFFTTLGDAGIVWILLTITLLIFPKTRKYGLTMAISLLLTFGIVNGIIKNAVHRDRPCWIDSAVELLVKSPKDFSFPSGHSANGMAVAFALFLHRKKEGLIALFCLLVIAFSRLYLFVHFPTDVLVGLAIGLADAVAAWFIVKLLKKKLPEKGRDFFFSGEKLKDLRRKWAISAENLE